ncbi:MAG: hypothetical protein WDZ94_01415 [Patescibacteria group bacterium]
MIYDLRQAFVPWRIIRFLSIVLLLIVLVTLEFAVSLPMAAASMFIYFVIQLHWLESWLLTIIMSLTVASLYLLSWPLVFGVLMLVVLAVMQWSAILKKYPFRIIVLGVLLGVVPVIAFDVLVTERVIGLSFINMVVVAVVIRKVLSQKR